MVMFPARRITKRNVESEFVQRDQWARRTSAFDRAADLLLIGRPDAQPAPRRPDAPLAFEAVTQSDLEAIEFHVGVKALLDTANETRAQVGLKMARKYRHRRTRHDDEGEEGSHEDREPPMPAPEGWTVLPHALLRVEVIPIAWSSIASARPFLY